MTYLLLASPPVHRLIRLPLLQHIGAQTLHAGRHPTELLPPLALIVHQLLHPAVRLTQSSLCLRQFAQHLVVFCVGLVQLLPEQFVEVMYFPRWFDGSSSRENQLLDGDFL